MPARKSRGTVPQFYVSLLKCQLSSRGYGLTHSRGAIVDRELFKDINSKKSLARNTPFGLSAGR